MSHGCFIHSSIDGHLGCFHILVIVNNAAMNIGVLMFFRISVLGYFGSIPKSGIARWKGRFIFNYLRYLHTAFHNVCTNVYSHQQCKRIPLSLHPCQHFLFVDLLMIVILPGVRWYLIVVFNCISPLATDVEHIFICLWVTVCPSWSSVYSGPFPIF